MRNTNTVLTITLLLGSLFAATSVYGNEKEEKTDANKRSTLNKVKLSPTIKEKPLTGSESVDPLQSYYPFIQQGKASSIK